MLPTPATLRRLSIAQIYESLPTLAALENIRSTGSHGVTLDGNTIATLQLKEDKIHLILKWPNYAEDTLNIQDELIHLCNKNYGAIKVRFPKHSLIYFDIKCQNIFYLLK